MDLHRFEAGDLPAVQELFAGSIRTVCRGDYTPGAEDGIVFTPVLDENENVAYFVAVGEDGVALFSVRPNGAENGFSVVQDGGLLVGSDIPARFTVDTEAMEQLPAGISFGDIA